MSAKKQVFCTECGAQLLPDAKFCGICGAQLRLGVDTEKTPSPVSPPTTTTDDDTRGLGAIPRYERPSQPPPLYSEPKISTQYQQGGPQQPQATPPYYVGTPTIWQQPEQKLKRLWETLLLSPAKGMRKVARGPDIGIPILVLFLVGLCTGLASYIYLQQRVTVNWVDMSGEQKLIWDSVPLSLFAIGILFSIISSFVASFLLYGVIAFFGKTAPYEKSFKQSFAIIGYAEVASLVFSVLSIPLMLFREEKTIEFGSDAGQMEIMEEITQILILPLEFQLFTLIFFGWSLVLIYFGIKGSFVKQTEVNKVFIIYVIGRTLLRVLFSV